MGVIGAGPAGLAAATVLATRGHEVHLYDAADDIGGQLNMARIIPGKEEFDETLRYYRKQISLLGVHLHLGTQVSAELITAEKFDDVIVATGVTPRDPEIPGQEHEKTLSYIDVLLHGREVGKRVAIVGAGGIGFDVAEFLLADGPSPTLDLERWLAEWGVVDPDEARGGISQAKPATPDAPREIYLLQRKSGKHGAGLGKTTGWIHRTKVKKRGVHLIGGVNYEGIGDEGLLISYGSDREGAEWLDVDNVVLCAGQLPQRELADALASTGANVHVIGGADKAAELDAKRAINQGSRLAATL